jgi:pimeloyl-ACP methyl ester carboxylesterase
VPYLLPESRVGSRVEGRGPPIVLLHSSMSSKSQWRELTESLRDRYRLIAIDLLGYGESAMPSSGDHYSLRDEVRLVESVLARELQPGEQFHLIGHSYGGIVALQLAAQERPQRVRSLSLFEPIAFHLLPTRDPDLAELEAVRREIADRLNAGDAHGGAACFVDCWSGAGAFAQLRPERQSVLAAQVPKVLLEYRAVTDEARNAAAYRRIDVPTCLVAGRWSPEVAQRLTSIFTEIIPHASYFEVAAGHMAPITHPTLVNPIFEKFVRAVDSSERRRAVANTWLDQARAAAFGLLAVAISVLPLFGMQGVAQHYFGIPPDVAYLLEDSAWQEVPRGMPPGARFSVISGNPSENGPFVMRVRLPPGYMLPPYKRPNEEQMIVLAGAITVGTGGGAGTSTVRTLTSGSYAALAAGEIHFAHTQHGAIVQIFGTGPFEIGG